MKIFLPRLNLGTLFGWRPGKLAKDTLVMSGGMGLRTVLQAAVFLIVARILGVGNYGAYAAVLALAGALGSFSGCGTQALIVRDVARDPDTFSAAWGRALAAIVASAPLVLLLYCMITWTVLPTGISFNTIILLGLAELVFAPLALATITAYQGHERIGRAARMMLVPMLFRLAAVLCLVPLATSLPAGMELTGWAGLYMLAALTASVYGWYRVRHDLGPADLPTGSALWVGLREGLAFAFGGAALRLYVDIDKVMLARLTTLTTTGVYSAGYRIADLASIPVLALLRSAMPRIFRTGDGNLRATLAYGIRLLPAPLIYALCVGVGLYATAGLLPYLLGAGFMAAVVVLRWLAWLPLVSLPRLFLQALLIGANRQYLSVAILGAGAVVNIGLNMGLIPLWDWRGAVMATYLAELGMAAIMFLIAWMETRSTPPCNGSA